MTLTNVLFQVGLATVPEIIKTAVTFIPALRNLPLLGKVVPLFSAGDLNETQTLEQLQRSKDRLKSQRARTRDRNGKYVIKVSDAMKCVEDNIDGALLKKIGKSIMDVLIGSGADLGTEIMDPIYRCLEENRLRQDTPRTAQRTSTHARPARGHGHGRRGNLRKGPHA